MYISITGVFTNTTSIYLLGEAGSGGFPTSFPVSGANRIKATRIA
jgi:hypothetical protein